MGVVGHLLVHEAGRVVGAAVVHVGHKDGHLLVRLGCVGRVNDVDLVGRWRGLRAGQGWLVANVGAVAALVEVLELPVVLEVVAVGQSGRSCLEPAVGRCGRTGADGDELTCVELVVGTQSVGGAAPGRTTVGGVVQNWGAARGRVDS